jgi:hypothetical protein
MLFTLFQRTICHKREIPDSLWRKRDIRKQANKMREHQTPFFLNHKKSSRLAPNKKAMISQ